MSMFVSRKMSSLKRVLHFVFLHSNEQVFFQKNEISKEGFVRHMRSIVGDQMLKMAVYKMQTQVSSKEQICLMHVKYLSKTFED